ncbi:MAG: guanylate kinase [Thermotogaceae bacterium]|nr:guanylate kinase [Thermotogaceae bacterium]
MIRKPILVVVSGPSGVGKTTIIKAVLAKRKDIIFSVSCTTRPKRPGEVHGKDYFFITEKEFKKMIERKEFLEWAEVHGYLYGTPRRFVEEAFSNNKSVLLDIDVQGAMKVMETFEDGVFIFVAPPSIEDLEKRLRKRKTEDERKIKRRLEDALWELRNIDKFQYLIINKDLDEAIYSLGSIVTAESIKVERLEDDVKRYKEEVLKDGRKG